MKGTFKWLALKAGTALSRNVSSLFYQLYYREFYREVQEITNNGAQTVDDCFKLGYLSAEESAERQKAVFRLFPSDPEKVLEYVPLLWELYFGQPMEEYTTEWDRSDPIRTILRYKIKLDPMTFEMGKDELRDNLPWNTFESSHNNKYGSLMAGLLTQCSSYVLKLRGQEERIILKNTKNQLQGDSYFEFECQVLPEDKFPYLGLDSSPKSLPSSSESVETNSFDKFISKITENFDIDTLDEIFDEPTGIIRIPLAKAIEKVAKMPSEEFLDHFTNDERKFIQVFGFITVHLTNLYGQIPQKMFEHESVAKVFAHQFLFYENNINRFFPISVIQDFKRFVLNIFRGISPDIFVSNLEAISHQEMIELYFQGAKKAFQDLGVTFVDLKPSLYQELQEINNQSINDLSSETQFGSSEKSFLTQQRKDQLYAQLLDEIMLLTTALFSIPFQFGVVSLTKLTAGTSEILTSIFKSFRETTRNIIDITDELNDLET